MRRVNVTLVLGASLLVACGPQRPRTSDAVLTRDRTFLATAKVEALCSGGWAPACALLASGMWTRGDDEPAALEYDRTACDGGVGSSCVRLARYYGSRDAEQAERYYRASCDLGKVSACLDGVSQFPGLLDSGGRIRVGGHVTR